MAIMLILYEDTFTDKRGEQLKTIKLTHREDNITDTRWRQYLCYKSEKSDDCRWGHLTQIGWGHLYYTTYIKFSVMPIWKLLEVEVESFD